MFLCRRQPTRTKSCAAQRVAFLSSCSRRSDDTDARPARSPTEFEVSIDFRIGWRFWHWGAVTQTHQFFICGSFIVANRFPRVLQRSSIKRPVSYPASRSRAETGYSDSSPSINPVTKSTLVKRSSSAGFFTDLPLGAESKGSEGRAGQAARRAAFILVGPNRMLA
jgi:hypothetical protein